MSDATEERPETFVARDRARRFAFRLDAIGRERASHYAGERIGMTSFAEAVPALLGVEDDLATTIQEVARGRLRDRERGEMEIPLVVALEGVAERVRRARVLEEARRGGRVGAEWAQARVLATLEGAVRRLEAFAETYDEERILALPAPTEVPRLLARVEEEAAIERLPAVPTQRPGLLGPACEGSLSPLVTAADALEDLLRAARAELPGASPPWHARRGTPTTPLVLELGEAPPEGSAEEAELPSLTGPSPGEGRTARAAQVVGLAHPVRVVRRRDASGETIGLRVEIRDAAAAAVEARVAAARTLPPEADAAVRAYLRASAAVADPLAPARLVATMGLLRAVERELERALRPALLASAAQVVAARVPREASRKAPIHREVLARLVATIPGFPEQHAGEVLDAIAAGKPPGKALEPPDVAIVFAVLGRPWTGGKSFGDRVLGLPGWTDEEMLTAAGEAIELAAIRTALERGRDPGEGWPARWEAAAFGLLDRLARKCVPPPGVT